MRRGVLLCAALACLAGFGYSQEVSGSINGRVTDPSGAAVARAAITATHAEQGAEWPAVTNEDGVYSFPRLPIGTYTVRVEANGFKTATRASFRLEVNQHARLDVELAIGTVNETVEVSGEAPLLQTDNTIVGTVVAPDTIANTPLISRNPVALTLLAPGVTTPNPQTLNNGQRNVTGGRPYVNGNREEANNFLLDGVDANQISDNLVAYQPNVDAIAEFRLITNNASAEFGNFQGGIVNVVLKSGTNRLHGSLFEFFRNDRLNANAWANNWQGVPRTALRWNQFGGTIGGPILRDKLFFFADYQGLRRHTPPSVYSATVAPAAWRTGDLSGLLDKTYTANRTVQFYNPYSVDASGQRQPFPNNQIPVSLFSPAIRALFADPGIYPLPNVTTTLLSSPNYFYSKSSAVISDQGDFKLDWKPGERDYFSARYSNARQDSPALTSLPFQYSSFSIAPFQNGVINYTRTLSPTLVNEARFGINHMMQQNGADASSRIDIAAKLGIRNTVPGLLALGSGLNGGSPFTYLTSLGDSNLGTQQLFATTTYHWADNVTLIRGRHLIKTGGQVLRQQVNAYYSGNAGRSGYMNFSGRFTAANAKSPSGLLLPEADFLLGLPGDLGRGVKNDGTWGQRKTIFGLYAQDDWRVTDRLTLNLGLRWEYHTPLVEVADRQVNFGLISGQLLVPGQDGNSRALYRTFKKDFQPRAGLAYHRGRLVARAAYTISSFMEGTGTNLRLPLNPPLNPEFQALYNTATDWMPATTLTDGIVGSRDPYVSALIRLWDPEVRPAITQQWNATLEAQLPAGMVATAGYIGQHGTHLIVAMPYIQKRLVNGAVQPSPYLSGNPELLSKISQISGTSSTGNQQYHALQTSLRKRYATGVEFQAAYTWSKGMSDSVGFYSDSGQAGPQSPYWQNLYDRKAEWGPTYFDSTHSFTSAFVYELPWGQGRRFASGWNPLVNALLGGWQAGGIFSAHTGFPLTIKMSALDSSGTRQRSYRATVKGTPQDPHIIGPNATWLDPSAYVQPPAGTFGTVGVGTSRGPGMVRFDASLGKRFAVGESRWVEFRAESFNLTNTPIYNSPASQAITSSLFGQIRTAQGERNTQLALKLYF